MLHLRFFFHYFTYFASKSLFNIWNNRSTISDKLIGYTKLVIDENEQTQQAQKKQQQQVVDAK